MDTFQEKKQKEAQENPITGYMCGLSVTETETKFSGKDEGDKSYPIADLSASQQAHGVKMTPY